MLHVYPTSEPERTLCLTFAFPRGAVYKEEDRGLLLAGSKAVVPQLLAPYRAYSFVQSAWQDVRQQS